MEGTFHWSSVIPVVKEVPDHVVTACLVVGGITVGSIFAARALKRAENPIIPEKKMSLRTFFEVLIEFVYTFAGNTLGGSPDKYFPLLGAFFIYILFNNLMGVIPGFSPPTSNINTNIAIAATSFLMYNYYGYREHGWKYIKQFMGPLIWIAPLMFVIELFSHIFRPISLSIRLFGNMFGDHMVMSIFSGLVPIVVPVVFMVLAIVVSLLQAFVFTLLSTVYIGLATSHDH